MFDFRVDDKVIVLEDVYGNPNKLLSNEKILFAPKGAKGIISNMNESNQRAIVEFEQDQGTYKSHITVPFENIQLQRKRRTTTKKETIIEEVKKEYPKTESKDLPKTSADLCKMFLNGQSEKYLTVKQTDWLRRLLEKEGHYATHATYQTNDEESRFTIQMLSGSSRLMRKEL